MLCGGVWSRREARRRGPPKRSPPGVGGARSGARVAGGSRYSARLMKTITLDAKVMQAIDVARKACAKQNLDTEASILDFFEKEGMIIIRDPDKEAFQKHAQWSYRNESKDISKDWDWDLYEKIQKMK